MVPFDTNNFGDIFVRDIQTDSTQRVSLTNGGDQAYGPSSGPDITPDGRYVVFQTSAPNLVGDDSGLTQVFRHDRETGDTALVSAARPGDRPDGESTAPSVSNDGRFVAFRSSAANLVEADSPGSVDVFVRDMQEGTTSLVSAAASGAPANAASGAPRISGDGKSVAFWSAASDLVAADANNVADIFVTDLDAGVTRIASIAPGGAQSSKAVDESSSISDDGRLVAFSCRCPPLGGSNNQTEVFVADFGSGQQPALSKASTGPQGIPSNSDSTAPALSADGRFVAFTSFASTLEAGDTNQFWDVFVHDTSSHKTVRVSEGSGGTSAAGATVPTRGAQGTGSSGGASITPDGRFVAFESNAANLVGSDTNGRSDVFLHVVAGESLLNPIDGPPPPPAPGPGVSLRPGTVYAWGDNANALLGSGGPSRAAPAAVEGLEGVSAISLGNAHGLALKADGTVVAWGDNSSGQLGNPSVQGKTFSPVPVVGLDHVTAIAAGGGHSVALRSDGNVWAWGLNTDGQAGVPCNPNAFNLSYSECNVASVPLPVRRVIPPPAGLEAAKCAGGGDCIRAISAGEDYTLALRENGAVVGWGRCDLARLGGPCPVSSRDQGLPIDVPGLSS
ncbi:MAG: hypothetical protein ACRDIU_09820, partial [Actinomycetota bacterium]